MTVRSTKDSMMYSRHSDWSKTFIHPDEPIRTISSTSSSRISLPTSVRCVSSTPEQCLIINSSLHLWTLARQARHDVLSRSLSVESRISIRLISMYDSPVISIHIAGRRRGVVCKPDRVGGHGRVGRSRSFGNALSTSAQGRWLSDDAIAAKRHRRRLERKWRETRSDTDRLQYRRA